MEDRGTEVQQEIDKIEISDEGVVALPHSLTSSLNLQPGDEVIARLDGTTIVLQRMNPKRVRRSEPRPLGHAKGEFHLPEGWELPMTDDEVDDFLNGR
jgi:bifunctional DNA-binding transcriptional regulator/antitoxin component of YhaV-PrlF toxin-antitoxin module